MANFLLLLLLIIIIKIKALPEDLEHRETFTQSSLIEQAWIILYLQYPLKEFLKNSSQLVFFSSECVGTNSPKDMSWKLTKNSLDFIQLPALPNYSIKPIQRNETSCCEEIKYGPQHCCHLQWPINLPTFIRSHSYSCCPVSSKSPGLLPFLTQLFVPLFLYAAYLCQFSLLNYSIMHDL